MVKTYLCWTVGFAVMVVCSCKKFVTAPAPEISLEFETVFSNQETAIAAIAGLYSQIVNLTLVASNGGLTLYPGLSADELYNTAPNSGYDGFRTNEIQIQENTGLNRIWNFSYRIIYHANAILEGLANSKVLSDSLKNTLGAEARMIRALHYFYLQQLYENIPLVTSTDYKKNQAQPASTSDELYAFIEQDLKIARQHLPKTNTSIKKSRPDYYAASALLARLSLYRQQWELAAAYSTEIINNNKFSLQADLNKVFVNTNTEAIWQLAPVTPIVYTAEGSFFIPTATSKIPTLAATDWLLNAFETGDKRQTSWLGYNTISGKKYYYPFKYTIRSTGGSYEEYYVIFRLAEQYLIRAEANIALNKLADAAADINTIRNRAGLAAVVYTNTDDLKKSLIQERRIELMFEWGHRWLDLKRWQLCDAVLGPIKAPGWQTTDKLYPILQTELDANPFLKQNPGY